MRLASADSQRSFREGGLQPMPAAAALAALGTALRGAEAQVVIASIDWSVLKPLHEARRARPFLSRLGLAPVRGPSTATGMPSLVERLKNAAVDSHHDLILSFVSAEVAAVLGLADGEPVPFDTGLFELGMDSLMSVELRRRLERGAGQALPSTLTFNYPTVSALTVFIDGQLRASTSATAPAPSPIAAAPIVTSADQGLDNLSDDELEARLLARLEQMR
jgi:acyl carrier protein